MERILLGLGAAGASLLIIAIVVAWWEHRRHSAELRRQLAWSENTRDLLQAHAQDVESRLSALAATVQAHEQSHQQSQHHSLQPGGHAGVHSAAARFTQASTAGASTATTTSAAATAPAALAAAATAAAAAYVAGPIWKDTEPMVLTGAVLDFDPTVPEEEVSTH